MARCPECNKFVSYGEPNTDAIELAMDGPALVLSGELVLPCGECSTDLAQATLEMNEDLSGSFSRMPDESAGETAEYQVSDQDLEPTERSGGTGRKGRRKLYRGVEASATIKQTISDKDGNEIHTEEVHATIAAEEQAAFFDSLV